MAALTGDRNTKRRSNPGRLNVPAAAAVTIYEGSLVSLDTSGYARPGRVSTTDKILGRAVGRVDNSGGLAGDLDVEIEAAEWCRFENSSAGDAIALTDKGDSAYVVDDQTVAKTDGSSTRMVAGEIMDVDSDGVWIKFPH